MCRASKAFKTEFLKNGYKNIQTKNSNFMVKNMHNDGLKVKIFEFLAVISQFKLKNDKNKITFVLKSKNMKFDFLIHKKSCN